MVNTPNTNSGHGHVWERPDGVKARCGGPKLCKECQADKGFVETLKQFPFGNILPDQVAEILWRLFDMGYIDREIELSVMSDDARLGTCFLCGKAKSDGVSTTMEVRISRDEYNRANGEKHVADLEQALTDALHWLGIASGEYSIPEELTGRIRKLLGCEHVKGKMEWKIYINAEEHTLDYRHVTYEDIVRLAKQSGNPTVVYDGRKIGDCQRSGILAPGHTLMIDDGMVFSAVHTNNA